MLLSRIADSFFVVSLPLILCLSYLPAYQTYQPLLQAVPVGEIKAHQTQARIQKIKYLQKQQRDLQARVDLIDQDLVGLSTYQVSFWSDRFKDDVSTLDFVSANVSLKTLEEEVEAILVQQNELAVQEEKRLLTLVGELVKEGKDILADVGEVEERYQRLQAAVTADLSGARCNEATLTRVVVTGTDGVSEVARCTGAALTGAPARPHSLGGFAVGEDGSQKWSWQRASLAKQRLSELRELATQATDLIKQRRVAMATAIKQIVIKKSSLTLAMYENGEQLYQMPISLGRRGYGTRTGEFAILDKLGTVWGVWRIYLPFWMGIYFAGSTENGIHGIPYDRAGNRYWVSDIGARNVTYGCVMPDDKDAQVLYDWAEVGTPVAIIN